MRTLIWIMMSAMLYTTPMTVDYTADGYTILVDEQGYEWDYERELGGERYLAVVNNNGTPEIEDDWIVELLPITDI